MYGKTKVPTPVPSSSPDMRPPQAQVTGKNYL